jgi:(1->4)-alpha-D-glucan 1-alpha-D-glucosylmutase
VVGKSLAPLTQGGRVWPSPDAYDGAIVVSGYSLEGISGNELPFADVFKCLPAAILKAKVAGRHKRKNLAAK